MDLKNKMKQSVNFFFFLISLMVKKKNNRIVFGSWFGDRYGDNPRFLIEWLAEHHPNEFELIWIGNTSVLDQIDITDRIKFLKKNSLLGLYYSITAKYAFFSHSHTDISNLNIFGNCITVQLWHGIPLKQIGDDAIGHESQDDLFSNIKKETMDNYTFYVSSSLENAKKLLSAFQSFGITEEKILTIGQPRNDFLLVQKEHSIIYKNKLYDLFPKIKGKKIITYMPTFRDKTGNNFSFKSVKGQEQEKLVMTLKKHNAVILEKNHYAEPDSDHDELTSSQFIISLTDVPFDTQELLLATDILITDYSSCYFDFLLLDRPIIHYTYDYQSYGSIDRGFYYQLEDVCGGSLVNTKEELIESINDNFNTPELHRNERLNTLAFLLNDEKGISNQEIYKRILKKKNYI
ncbi:CDP-glycerol glycerophosphotransferase family protein [Neobacillus ginsengisoli]|uniref:CDP-glycerol glycerophosphotransferase n=1 Tax=Neobacillus ginsengisoli TaxID=904295 RepID=A0ABT9XWM6_9BACI|nr:CDP-glycerol glycerophosphotransferase family protein [Neobacillus ginsengisoli]MDQ0199783.1 CDP-glycerol glycerophosphotransferase [Neobacillus ginsengisoli]